MEQLVEIMDFSVSIFVMRVSGASSVEVAQILEWGYSTKNNDSSSVKKFTKSVA
jgi:hypothetical protein